MKRQAVVTVLAATALLGLGGCTTPAPSPSPSIGTPVGTVPGTSDTPVAPATPGGTASGPANWVSPVPGSTTACAADTGYAVNETGEYWLTGDCPLVSVSADGADLQSAGAIAALSVQGRDNDVDARAVGALTVAGDGNDIDADALTSGRIAGQENDLSVASADNLVVNGDRNNIEADTRIGSLTVNGNGNEVEAQSIDNRDIVGTGNRVTP